MPWRSRTRMPTRRPAKAATVVKRQEPSIQASGIFSQLNRKPPTAPITIASTTGADAVVADDVLALGLEREVLGSLRSAREAHGANCSFRMRSSRSCSGSNSRVSSMSVASVTTTLTTLAISTEFGRGGDRPLLRPRGS